MSTSVAWTIVVPLVGAVLSAIAGARTARWIAAATTAATVGVIAVVTYGVATAGPLHHAIGGWGAPLGIELRADGFAAVMLATIAIVSSAITIQAIRRGVVRARAKSRFFTLWFFTWAALDALVLSADVFNLYVTLELITLATVGLIALSGGRRASAAALRYLLLAIAGSLVYLLGVALLYQMHATLDLALLGARVSPGPTSWLPLALMTAGLCLKAALFPLHAWLPPAYVAAPPAVSALLSALVGKASFLVLARLWLQVFPAELAAVAGPVLGVLASGAILWCSVFALRQPRLVQVIAYSSVAHVGYLFMAFAIDTADAWAGALYVAMSHAAAAAAMFLAAGTIRRTLGHDRVDGLGGLTRRLPVTFFALGLAGLSLMGMPPTGGFIGKWLLVRAALETGAWWLALVMVLGGFLAAAYVFRLLRRAFLPPPAEEMLDPSAPGGERLTLALAIVGVVLGVAPSLPLELISIGSLR